MELCPRNHWPTILPKCWPSGSDPRSACAAKPAPKASQKVPPTTPGLQARRVLSSILGRTRPGTHEQALLGLLQPRRTRSWKFHLPTLFNMAGNPNSTKCPAADERGQDQRNESRLGIGGFLIVVFSTSTRLDENRTLELETSASSLRDCANAQLASTLRVSQTRTPNCKASVRKRQEIGLRNPQKLIPKARVEFETVLEGGFHWRRERMDTVI